MPKSIDWLKNLGSQKGAEEEVRQGFWSYLKKNKSRINFFQKLEVVYEWLTSGKLSRRDKAVVLGALIYFINPIDAVPDPTPFVGFVDDAALIALAFRYVTNRSIEDLDKNQKPADSEPTNPEPSKDSPS